MTTYFCLPYAESNEYSIIDGSEHDVNDGEDHTECVEVEVLFSYDGWRGVTIPALVVNDVWEMSKQGIGVEGEEPVKFTLDYPDMILLSVEQYGNDTWEIKGTGMTYYVSECVAGMYSEAIDALTSAGFYVETEDGFTVYEPVKEN